ncbi:MAG: MBL fold metallo-hydrolase, partial [Planctomycetales bacterium]|nr:MBL fold metallo-hydrolase [Planctomycetales bacterium]
VHLVRKTEESKALNHIEGPAVIISSSGMMTGGRIVHHLRQRLPHERNTIVLGGYMAEGTRGRILQNGSPTLRMFGQEVPIRAAIESIPGLSGHADRSGLYRWLDHLPHAPRKTFITHGEPESSDAMAADLRNQRNWDVVCPELGQSFEL